MDTSNTAHSRSAATTQHEDAVTFDQVYTRHWKPLYRAAFRILKDEQAAEDIIQDTFIRLWEKWDTIAHTNIKGWLFTTSYHLVLKNLKQLQARTCKRPICFQLLYRTILICSYGKRIC